MIKKHLFNKPLVCLFVFAFIFVVGCGRQSPVSEPPLTTEVIDLSHNSTLGYGFGDGPDPSWEAKRWQTFTATSHPVVTEVEVKLRKLSGSGTYTPVLVELYQTTVDGNPTGQRLAYGLIPPAWIETEFTVVRTGLNYNGLTAGNQYAIVLTQGVLNNAHYEWCTQAVNPELRFGKYTVNDGWTNESHLGDGWLKVYVASRTTPPTRIFMYFATAVHDGNLKGSYPDARTGADFIAADRPLGLAVKTTHAFISISSNDSIADMPTHFGFPNNIPIVGVMGNTKIIADNWADLLDGSIKINLSEALGLPGSDSWWSGSNVDGTYDVSSSNCSGWTNIASDGMSGIPDIVDNTWIHFANGIGSYARWVLGIAY